MLLRAIFVCFLTQFLVECDATRQPRRRVRIRYDRNFAHAVNDFGVSLFSELAPDNENLVLAPIGVLSTMGMVMLGARGQTEQNLFQGLKLQPLRRTRKVKKAFKRYRKSLAVVSNVTLDMANALFVEPNATVLRKFTKQAKKCYGGRATRYDFNSAGGPEAPINEWIETKTRGMIRNFLQPGDINTDTFMWVVNAIYFKGTWQSIFMESLTRERTFHVSSSRDVTVNMMTNDDSFASKYDSNLRVKVLEMPYQGQRFSFYILLPDEFGLTQLESRLDYATLEGLLTNLNGPSRLMITIPKFKLTSSLDELVETLKDMGISDVFRSRVADLSGINGRDNLFVDVVKQKSVIEVDEIGTVAAAVTGVRVVAESMPPTFTVDRPFLFVLRDNTARVNLFIGRVNNPTTANQE